MSVKASNWAWNQTLKPTPKLVLMRLADFAGQDGLCYASIGRLIKDVGVSKSTVVRALKDLEKDCFITKIRNQRKNFGHAANSYILNMIPQDVVPPCVKMKQGGGVKMEQGLVSPVAQGKKLTLKQKKEKKKKKILEPKEISIDQHDQKWMKEAITFADEPHPVTVRVHLETGRKNCRCLFCSTNRCWHKHQNILKKEATG